MYGETGVRNQIGISLPRDIKNELCEILSWSRLRSYDCKLVETDDERIELKLGQQSFTVNEPLYLQLKPRVAVLQRLEEISDQLESGAFEIKYTTATGKEKGYTPKSIEVMQ